MSVVETINIEIAYATPDTQIIKAMNVDVGTTAEMVIAQSGFLGKFPEINLEDNKIGIFGKVIKKDAALKEGDRVEIYRPLIADPKEIRRQRAEQGKAMKKGASAAVGKSIDEKSSAEKER